MSTLFPHAKRLRLGYHVGQVDTFFARARAAYDNPQPNSDVTAEEVRRTAFDLRRGGYATAAVDGAMDRLEWAFAERVKQVFVRERGQDAWMQDLAQRAQVLYPRLRRPKGKRFRSPVGLGGGYDRKQVDALMDRVTAFFDTGKPLSAEEVRAATFKRRLKPFAYDERTVDVYLARTVDILLGVA